MRAAYICADLGVPVFGTKGCSTHVQEIVRAFRRLGIDVDLYASRLGGEPAPDLADLRVIRLPHPTSLATLERERAAIDANVELLAELSQDSHYDLVYERYSLWSYAGMDWARAMAIPSIMEVNAPLIDEQQQHRELHHIDEARAIESRALNAATAIVAVSEEVASYVRARVTDGERVHVIPNGVDPERFAVPNGTLRRDSKRRFTIGFVGTLKPWHGVSQLLEAFVRFRQQRDAQLLIVGDGPERQRLEAALADVPPEVSQSIIWTGAVPPHKIPELISTMDIAVAPYPATNTFYFSPLKVFEYMAAGVATIASDIGQLRDVIDDCKDGILVRAGDVNDLVMALMRVHDNNDLRSRVGASARQKISGKFTWECVARRILGLVSSTEATTEPWRLRTAV